MKSQQTPTCDGCDSRDHETQQLEADNAKLRNDSCELVAHGDRFVYASEYEALEADNAKLDAELAEHKETLSEWHDSFHALEADNAKLRGDLRHKTLQWEGVKDMLAQRTEENAKLREQLAKAQR